MVSFLVLRGCHFVCLLTLLVKQSRSEIPLPERWDDNDNVLALEFRAFGDGDAGDNGSAARDATKEALLSGEPPCHLDGSYARNLYNLIIDGCVQAAGIIYSKRNTQAQERQERNLSVAVHAYLFDCLSGWGIHHKLTFSG